MLTYTERIRALETNLENWPWDTSPSFKLEKEEADIILDLIDLIGNDKAVTENVLRLGKREQKLHNL